jgi:hypothetical protein
MPLAKARVGTKKCVGANTHYKYFRDYDPAVGRYVESEPIGLGDGPNTYSPLSRSRHWLAAADRARRGDIAKDNQLATRGDALELYGDLGSFPRVALKKSNSSFRILHLAPSGPLLAVDGTR